MTSKRAASLFAVVLLSACGGGGGGTPVVVDPNPTIPNAFDFDDANKTNAELLRLGDRLKAVDPNLVSTIPTSETVNYDGLVSVALPNAVDGVVGPMRLSVDFATNKLSGEAGNFIDFSNRKTVGGLTFRNGTLNRSGTPQLSMAISGLIDFDAGLMDVRAAGEGRFGESNAEILVVQGQGVATPAGGTARPLEIIGIAEQQP